MSEKNSSTAGIPYAIESLQQHITDAKLRLALLEYQQKKDQAWRLRQDALPSSAPERVAESEFFARTEKKTLSLIRRREPRLMQPAQARRRPRLLQVFAAAVLILVLALGTALAVSPTLRIQVLKLLYHITPRYTEVRFVPGIDASFEVPPEWAGTYFPSYIPSGYGLLGSTASTNVSKAVFTSGDNKYLRFSEHLLGAELSLDSEGFHTEEVEIRGKPGLMSWSTERSILVWPSDDKLFVLDVTENKSIAMEVALSVTRIK